MDTLTKLGILAEAAKYDVACTSSGVQRSARRGSVGMASSSGLCHSFTPDGRCITLLKVLMSNACTYDCAYCVNRRSASCRRATFEPRELAELTVDFYKRNLIEGLFLSCGVLGTPDATTERMIECLRVLRQDLRFNGYVHAKIIPGTSPELVDAIGHLADRLSVNLELPSAASLEELCPDKHAKGITHPMAQIRATRDHEAKLLGPGRGRGRRSRKRLAGPGGATKISPAPLGETPTPLASEPAPTLEDYGQPHVISKPGGKSPVPNAQRRFAPAGQSTQIIIGASPEDDNHILQLSWALYQKFDLKRVFFSAYMPMLEDDRLPDPGTPVPLRREHRLYQADWLMRYYAFTPDELATPSSPWLDLDLDPKMAWALGNLGQFPVEVMEAPLEQLLRVPGIGPVGARRIVTARRTGILGFDDLRRMRITLKRARPFITCNGKTDPNAPLDPDSIRRQVRDSANASKYNATRRQMEGQPTLF